MTKFVLMAAVAVFAGPALAQAQTERVGQTKQKAWQVANFSSGLSDCSMLREGSGFALAGTASLTFVDRDSDNDGYDFAVRDGGGSVPEIAAHANTKVTGAQNGRSAGRACGLAPSPRGTIPAGRASAVAGISGGAVAGIVVATCSISGDPAAPIVRFSIPLASFGVGAARDYVGHVTLIRREASTPSVSEFVTPGGMAMKVVAACDAAGIAAKAGAARAGYELAVGKKI